MQQAIKSARYCLYNNRVSELAVRNPKKRWKQVKSLTGQGISAKQKWYYQFLSDTTLDDSNLATEINNFFSNITKHFEPLASVQTPTELSKNRSNLVLLDTCLSYQQNQGSTYRFVPVILEACTWRCPTGNNPMYNTLCSHVK